MKREKWPTLHVINLAHRTDRLEALKRELARQEIQDYRIWPGIVADRSSKGIAAAHQQIVKWAAENNLQEVTIAEDDVLFTDPGAFKHYINNKPVEFDLYLGGITYGNIGPDNNVTDFAGTHLYTIHKNFFNIFLSHDGQTNIDRSLKGKGKFVVCNPMVALQRNGFSDNRKREMDYTVYFEGRRLYKNPLPFS